MVKKRKEMTLKVGKMWAEEGVLRACVTAKEFDIKGAKETTVAGAEMIRETGLDLLLVDFGECKKISSEARKYMRDISDQPSIRKLALLVRNPVARVLGSFFMGIQKPKVPTKMFDNAEDAIKWLKKQGTS